MLTIGIVGAGYCGSATSLFVNPKIRMMIYDIVPDKCYPIGLKIEELVECDLIFICVPTPSNIDGSCHTKIVEHAVNDIKKIINPNKTHLIIRSTVPPHTSESLGCNFMPEFLTEKNWRSDFYNCPVWIVGCINSPRKGEFKQLMTDLITSAYMYLNIKNNTIQFVETAEAEMIKYFRNNFLAVKVSFCNEMYEFCNRSNIDYNTVRDLAICDPRIGSSHTFVPGHDGEFGYGGTCLVKDTCALLSEMTKSGMNSYIVNATVKRNIQVDRPNYKGETGRASL